MEFFLDTIQWSKCANPSFSLFARFAGPSQMACNELPDRGAWSTTRADKASPLGCRLGVGRNRPKRYLCLGINPTTLWFALSQRLKLGVYWGALRGLTHGHIISTCCFVFLCGPRQFGLG